MFERPIDYPCAIADQTDEGAVAALNWLRERKQENEELTLWVMYKRTLSNNNFLQKLSRAEGRRLKIVVKRPLFRVNGPVLAMYPDIDNLAYITSASGITALAVVQWADKLETWTKEVKAEVVHVLEAETNRVAMYGAESEPELTPDVIAGLEHITASINHNNTIAARGFEKDITVRELLRLYDAGFALPPKKMAEWAIAHGWRNDNPKELISWVRKINSGTRPRISKY